MVHGGRGGKVEGGGGEVRVGAVAVTIAETDVGDDDGGDAEEGGVEKVMIVTGGTGRVLGGLAVDVGVLGVGGVEGGVEMGVEMGVAMGVEMGVEVGVEVPQVHGAVEMVTAPIVPTQLSAGHAWQVPIWQYHGPPPQQSHDNEMQPELPQHCSTAGPVGQSIM